MADQSIQSCDVASRNQRLVNCLLDAFPVWFLMGFFISVLGTADAAFWLHLGNPAVGLVISYVSAFIYYFLCESLWQKTLAKLVTGTRVVALDGAKPTRMAVAIRTLVRFVPFEFVSFFTKDGGGWHDRWSGTLVVRTEPVPAHKPQPVVNEPMENTGFAGRHTYIPSWDPVDQRGGNPEPIHARAGTHTPRAQGTGPARNIRNMKWVAIAGPLVILLGVFMVWSANQPVESASASSTSGNQTDAVSTPPSAPSASVPPSTSLDSVLRSLSAGSATRSVPSASAPRSVSPGSVQRSTAPASVPRSVPPASVPRSVPSASAPRSVSPGSGIRSVPVDSAPSSAPSDFVPRSAPWGSAPLPEATPSSPPAGLPATIQADAFEVVDGKLVIYSDMGELAEGQTVSGWKIVRVTRREVTFKSGDATHTVPVSRPGAN